MVGSDGSGKDGFTIEVSVMATTCASDDLRV